MPDPGNWVTALLVLAGAALAGLLLLVLGFRLLLPLRLPRRAARLIIDRLGAFPLLLCLLWTVALVPAPFVFLWGWLIRFGQALLVDTPRQIVALPSVLSACTGSGGICASSVSAFAASVWGTAVSPAARGMQVPPGTPLAALVFTVALSLVALARPAVRPGALAGLIGRRTGAVAALAVSFLAALYLGIASILAIPVFSETVPDLAPLQAELVTRLRELTPADAAFPVVDQLGKERSTIDARLGIPSEPKPGDTNAPASMATGLGTIWVSQLDGWDRTYTVLQQDSGAFVGNAADFGRTAVSFFETSDQGHVDAEATRRHVTVLVNSYGLWMADYRAGIERCIGSLRAGLGQLRTLRTALVQLSQVSPEGFTSAFTDQLRNLAQRDYAEPCNRIRPETRDYLPARTGPVETLGPFGFAASWLLRTESPELALIVGLLGFGFFGALATSFIREFRQTPGNDLPAIGFILPALIRGIGAAILVFLLAKGGMAIFTKGDATPNAYAIFFACFVAAVFSDDVWLWARTRQRTGLGAGETREGRPAADLDRGNTET